MKRSRFVAVLAILFLAAALIFNGAPASLAADESWEDYAVTSWYDGAGARPGTAEEPYLITTAEELAGLAKLVKESVSTFSGKYFELKSDLDLRNIEWLPIGRFMSNGSNYGFAGSFDGNGHSIKGLFVSKVSNAAGSSMQTECPGLFGYLTPTGSISGLYVEGVVKDNVAQGAAVLVTWNTGTISNCVVSGDITAEGAGRSYAGGIAAVSNGGVIKNCVVYGSYQGLASLRYPGELVGYASQAAQSKFYNCVGLADKAGAGISSGMISSLGENCYWLKEDDRPDQPSASGTTPATKITTESEAPLSAVLLDPASLAEERVINRSYNVTLATYPRLSASADVACEWTFDDPDVTVAAAQGALVTIDSATEGVKSFTVRVTGINGIASGDIANALVLKGSLTIGVIPITSIGLDKTELKIEKGGSRLLTCLLEPSDTTDRNIVWESSNSTVAAVGTAGRVVAVGAGTAVITAKAGGFTVECEVTVTASENNISGEIPSGPVVPDSAEAVMAVAVGSDDIPEAASAIGASENDFAVSENGAAHLADETVKAGVNNAVANAVAQGNLPEGTTVKEVTQLPVFSASVQNASALAVVAFEVSGSQLLAPTPQDIKLTAVRFDESAPSGVFFRLANSADEYTDGHFLVQDEAGNILGAADKIDGARKYKLVLYINDNGNFDLDQRPKRITATAVIMRTSDSQEQRSGGSSSGCNGGYGLLALLALMPLIKRRNGR